MIELNQIRKTYTLGDLDVPVLRGVNLKIEDGEYVALMGSSGSGKSTLMNLIGCLDEPTAGTYLLDGADVSSLDSDARAQIRNTKLGFVFQNFNLLRRTSAIDNVLLPLQYAHNRISPAAGAARAEALLRRLGLGDRLHHEPSQLSGGQQQRVAIARALINEPPILLADEPTGNLDSNTTVEIMQLLHEINTSAGKTVLIVTHDPEIASQTRRVVTINDGVVIKDEINRGFR